MARTGIDIRRMLDEVRRLVEVLDPRPLPVPVSRDPNDDAVLALALAAHVDLIISGDADLLSLGSHAGIRIVAPAEALALLTG